MAGEVYRDVVVRVSVVPKDTRGFDQLRSNYGAVTEEINKYGKLLEGVHKRHEDMSAGLDKVLNALKEIVADAAKYQSTISRTDYGSQVRQSKQVRDNLQSAADSSRSIGGGGTYSLERPTITAAEIARKRAQANHMAMVAGYRETVATPATVAPGQPGTARTGGSGIGPGGSLSDQFGNVVGNVGRSTEGLLKFQRGLALMEASGGNSLQKTIEAIARLQARIDLFRGSIDIVVGLSKAFQLVTASAGTAAAAQAGGGVAGAAGAAGGSAAGSMAQSGIAGTAGGMASRIPGVGLAIAAGIGIGYGTYSITREYLDRQRRRRQQERQRLVPGLSDTRRAMASADFANSAASGGFSRDLEFSGQQFDAGTNDLAFLSSVGGIGDRERRDRTRAQIEQRDIRAWDARERAGRTLFRASANQQGPVGFAVGPGPRDVGLNFQGRVLRDGEDLARTAPQLDRRARGGTQRVTEIEAKQLQTFAETQVKFDTERVAIQQQRNKLIQDEVALHAKILDSVRAEAASKQDEVKSAREQLRSEEARFGRMGRGDQMAAERLARKVQGGGSLTERDARTADRLGLFQKESDRFFQERGRQRGANTVLAAGDDNAIDKLRIRREELKGILDIQGENVKVLDDGFKSLAEAAKDLDKALERAKATGDAAAAINRLVKMLEDTNALQKVMLGGF